MPDLTSGRLFSCRCTGRELEEKEATVGGQASDDGGLSW